MSTASSSGEGVALSDVLEAVPGLADSGNRSSRLHVLESAPAKAPKPPRRERRVARRRARRAAKVRRAGRDATWAGFGAWCGWALIALAPAALAIWLVGSGISFAGYKAGRGLILMLCGLSVAAWLNRRRISDALHQNLDPQRRADNRRQQNHWEQDIQPGFQWRTNRYRELKDGGLPDRDAWEQAGDEMPLQYLLCPDCHHRMARCKCGDATMSRTPTDLRRRSPL